MPLIEMRFPPKGTLLTPVLPGPDQRAHLRDPAAARRARRRRRQGGRRPDARRPGDDPLHRRLRQGPRRQRRTSCARCSAAARAVATTPTARTPSTSSPTPATCRPSSPSRASRSSSSGSGWPWTPAAPGSYRGGLGYEKHIRMLKDGALHVHRRPLDPGLLGRQGRQGRQAVRGRSSTPAARTSARSTPSPTTSRSRPARSIRIRTTGGGGWGDPLERDPTTRSCATCVWGKVSSEAARRDYGVVLTGATTDDPVLDAEPPRDALREARRAERREEPFFDRGPGYARLWPAARPPPTSTGSEGGPCDRTAGRHHRRRPVARPRRPARDDAARRPRGARHQGRVRHRRRHPRLGAAVRGPGRRPDLDVLPRGQPQQGVDRPGPEVRGRPPDADPARAARRRPRRELPPRRPRPARLRRRPAPRAQPRARRAVDQRLRPRRPRRRPARLRPDRPGRGGPDVGDRPGPRRADAHRRPDR